MTILYLGVYGIKALCHNANSDSMYMLVSWNMDFNFIWKRIA